MIVVLRPRATLKEIGEVYRRVEAAGFPIHATRSDEGVVLGLVGHKVERLRPELAQLSGVQEILDARAPFTLASREYRRADTVVDVRGVAIGGAKPVLIAGPCAVEDFETLLATAQAVKGAGADCLRGGAFKPRTSPYSFCGLGAEGLAMLRAVGRQTGLPVVSEILSPGDVDLFVQHVDVLQVGARNMQNFSLLGEVGRTHLPVLLKRGMMSTIEELLLAAEYILARGNPNVILCERGIRTFETSTRNTPDIAAIPVVKQLSHLPILFDPSHAAGRRRFVAPFARAGIAAGADGLLVEVHVAPERALCDGDQALTPDDFRSLVADFRRVAAAVGRPV